MCKSRFDKLLRKDDELHDIIMIQLVTLKTLLYSGTQEGLFELGGASTIRV